MSNAAAICAALAADPSDSFLVSLLGDALEEAGSAREPENPEPQELWWKVRLSHPFHGKPTQFLRELRLSYTKKYEGVFVSQPMNESDAIAVYMLAKMEGLSVVLIRQDGRLVTPEYDGTLPAWAYVPLENL